jgi:Kef-type K+ transport system membrane component KefB
MIKLLTFFLALFSPYALAAAVNTPEHDPVSPIILWVTLIFLFALLGRYIAKRLHQPGVLGELLAGVLIGNLFYYFGSNLFVVLREGSIVFNIMRAVLDGVSLPQAVHAIITNPHDADQMINVLKSDSGIEFIKVGYVLDIFSRYGVIFLLFMVGLESSFEDLKRTGGEATRVAIIGVIAPIILGFGIAFWLVPNSSFQTALFVAATLSATSIGITARVLSEMKKLNTREAKTILGAAMLDDVLGLIILAIVSSIVIGGVFEVSQILQIVFSALLFFVGVLTIGPWVLRKSVKCFGLFELWEAKLFVSFLFVMLLSWLATLVNLSSIIGAFSAGLIIHDGFFELPESKQRRFNIKDLVSPFEAILLTPPPK